MWKSCYNYILYRELSFMVILCVYSVFHAKAPKQRGDVTVCWVMIFHPLLFCSADTDSVIQNRKGTSFSSELHK